jgi:hypothetical protein
LASPWTFLEPGGFLLFKIATYSYDLLEGQAIPDDLIQISGRYDEFFLGTGERTGGYVLVFLKH